jgi:peptide/nickel transport system permease protein
VTALIIGLPELVIVTFAVLVLATWLGLVPAVVVPRPDGGIPFSMLVVPVVALGLPLLAWLTRMVRASVLDALEMPHVGMAALDGLSPARVLVRHVLPFALPAIAAAFGVACVWVLSGAVVVEAYVNYPGLGGVLAAAVDARDVPLASGTVAAVSTVMVLVLACADATRRLFPAPAQR